MPKQHATMRRVYDAAIRHKIIEGKSPLTELAAVLEVDAPQRVKNWDTRGASGEAMLLIQKKTGINATWVETGEGPDLIAGATQTGTSKTQPTLAATLAHLGTVLSAMPPAGRYRIADMLSALALGPDSRTLQESIAAELTGSASVGIAASDDTEGADSHASTTWRQQAMRLAEAHPDGRSKILLTEFLGKLDSVMRDPAPKARAAKAKG